VHDAKSGKNIALDFREVAPSKATRDMYVGADGKVIDGKSLYTTTPWACPAPWPAWSMR